MIPDLSMIIPFPLGAGPHDPRCAADGWIDFGFDAGVGADVGVDVDAGSVGQEVHKV
jgi:hypothetical protein